MTPRPPGEDGDELIGLGRWDVPASRLRGGAGAEEAVGEVPAALRRAVAEWSELPATGWVELVVDGPQVVFGVEDDDGPGWTLLTLQRTTAGWRYGGSEHARPGEPRAQRAVGIRLAWGRPAFVVHEGERPELELWLHNDRDEPWSYEGTCDALVSVVDPGSGVDPAEGESTAYAPVHAHHVVPPGGAIPVRTDRYFGFPPPVGPGRHLLVATLHEHGLRSDPAVLEVLSGRRSGEPPPPPERRGTPVRMVDDGPEEWARRCVARALGVEVEAHDDGSAVFPCALRIGPEARPERMIAVAGAHHPAWAHTYNTGPGIDSVPLPDVVGTWLVEVPAGADLDAAAVALPDLLRRISEAGVHRLGPGSGPPDLVASCRSEGVHRARRIRADGSGHAHLLPAIDDRGATDPSPPNWVAEPAVPAGSHLQNPTDPNWVSGPAVPVGPSAQNAPDPNRVAEPAVPLGSSVLYHTALVDWVGAYLRGPACAGVLAALRANPAPHREVFIGVTLTAAPWLVASTLAGVDGAAPTPPESAPDLPGTVTAVWIASLLPLSEPVGLHWDGARWTTFTSWGEGIDDLGPPRGW